MHLELKHTHIDDDSENKKAKGIKRCVAKRRVMFENYKDYCSIIKQ